MNVLLSVTYSVVCLPILILDHFQLNAYEKVCSERVPFNIDYRCWPVFTFNVRLQIISTITLEIKTCRIVYSDILLKFETTVKCKKYSLCLNIVI